MGLKIAAECSCRRLGARFPKERYLFVVDPLVVGIVGEGLLDYIDCAWDVGFGHEGYFVI